MKFMDKNYFLLLLLSSYIRTQKRSNMCSVMSIYNYLRLRGVSIGILHQSHRCTHLTTQNNLGYCQCYKKHTKNTKKLYYAYLNIIIYYTMVHTQCIHRHDSIIYYANIKTSVETFTNLCKYKFLQKKSQQELGLTHSTWRGIRSTHSYLEKNNLNSYFICFTSGKIFLM